MEIQKPSEKFSDKTLTPYTSKNSLLNFKKAYKPNFVIDENTFKNFGKKRNRFFEFIEYERVFNIRSAYCTKYNTICYITTKKLTFCDLNKFKRTTIQTQKRFLNVEIINVKPSIFLIAAGFKKTKNTRFRTILYRVSKKGKIKNIFCHYDYFYGMMSIYDPLYKNSADKVLIYFRPFKQVSWKKRDVILFCSKNKKIIQRLAFKIIEDEKLENYKNFQYHNLFHYSRSKDSFANLDLYSNIRTCNRDDNPKYYITKNNLEKRKMEILGFIKNEHCSEAFFDKNKEKLFFATYNNGMLEIYREGNNSKLKIAGNKEKFTHLSLVEIFSEKIENDHSCSIKMFFFWINKTTIAVFYFIEKDKILKMITIKNFSKKNYKFSKVSSNYKLNQFDIREVMVKGNTIFIFDSNQIKFLTLTNN